jgi:hypothetical protein
MAIYILLGIIVIMYYLFYINIYLLSYGMSALYGLYLLMTRPIPLLLDFWWNLTKETTSRLWPYMRWLIIFIVAIIVIIRIISLLSAKKEKKSTKTK